MVNEPLLPTKIPPPVVFRATKLVMVVTNGSAAVPGPVPEDDQVARRYLVRGGGGIAVAGGGEPATVSVTVVPATVQGSVMSPGVLLPAVTVVVTLPLALMPNVGSVGDGGRRRPGCRRNQSRPNLPAGDPSTKLAALVSVTAPAA